MGKFLDTTYRDTINDLTGFNETLIDQALYIFNDTKPVYVTYYNINKDFSSVDPGSKLQYDNVGFDSPMKYNRVFNFAIYGFNKIELSNEIGEFGLESNPITGDAYILPNTIIPYENDYFEVAHIKDSTWLFIVTDVQKDTLDNGANAYKISYRLEYDDNSKILQNIKYDFELIEKHEGTNVVSIVRREDVELARKFDECAVKLKKYFNELFYNQYVQTFIYQPLTEIRVYDSYLIEFLIRNKIMDNGYDDFIYVDHKIPTAKTFTMDYDKVFMRAFEKKDHDNIRTYRYKTYINKLRVFGSVFNGRYEDYYYASYGDIPVATYNCFDEDLMDHINSNILYDDVLRDVDEPSNLWKNILIKHFYPDTKITQEELDAINTIDFSDSTELFYCIPLLIYCLERRIEDALK